MMVYEDSSHPDGLGALKSPEMSGGAGLRLKPNVVLSNAAGGTVRTAPFCPFWKGKQGTARRDDLF
jgi:hypothetical protein